MMPDELSILPLNGNQDITPKSTYKNYIVSEINYTKNIREGNFPINLKLIKQHQLKTPAWWLNIKRVCTTKAIFVRVVI